MTLIEALVFAVFVLRQEAKDWVSLDDMTDHIDDCRVAAGILAAEVHRLTSKEI
jgi:hypothetical protein